MKKYRITIRYYTTVKNDQNQVNNGYDAIENELVYTIKTSSLSEAKQIATIKASRKTGYKLTTAHIRKSEII